MSFSELAEREGLEPSVQVLVSPYDGLAKSGILRCTEMPNTQILPD